MAKKITKKITKETEYAIKYLSNTMQMSNKDISNELGISVSSVNKIIEAEPKPKSNTKSKSHDLMIRHTSAKKMNNVSIMTEAASQYNDEIKSQRPKTKPFKDCIHQSRPND
jgi:ribosome-binding protein aMBF1 (putative translation factor)